MRKLASDESKGLKGVSYERKNHSGSGGHQGGVPSAQALDAKLEFRATAEKREADFSRSIFACKLMKRS